MKPGRHLARNAEVFEILMVCTANICRSPLAEHLLRDAMCDAQTWTRFQVSSAGIRGWDSAPMDAEMTAELRRLGGDASRFRSQSLVAAHCQEADLILTATSEHRAFVLELAPRALRRTFTLLEFAHLVNDVESVKLASGSPRELVRLAGEARGSASLEGYDVPDPYGGSAQVRRQAVDLIQAAVGDVAAALIGGQARRAETGP